MTWSFSIGKFAGTVVRIHVTFFLLLIWIWFMHYRIGGGAAARTGYRDTAARRLGLVRAGPRGFCRVGGHRAA